jgi:hypothetical protein
MSNDEGSGGVQGLASIAAIVCAFVGFSKGGWGGALLAAVMAYGGVILLVHAIGIALSIAALGGVLFIIVLILKSRWEWFERLFS